MEDDPPTLVMRPTRAACPACFWLPASAVARRRVPLGASGAPQEHLVSPPVPLTLGLTHPSRCANNTLESTASFVAATLEEGAGTAPHASSEQCRADDERRDVPRASSLRARERDDDLLTVTTIF